jgi:hypothetical protein
MRLSSAFSCVSLSICACLKTASWLCDHAVSLGQLTHQRQQGRSHLLRLQGVKVVCGDHGRR